VEDEVIQREEHVRAGAEDGLGGGKVEGADKHGDLVGQQAGACIEVPIAPRQRVRHGALTRRSVVITSSPRRSRMSWVDRVRVHWAIASMASGNPPRRRVGATARSSGGTEIQRWVVGID
jgi:hypothetical protein